MRIEGRARRFGDDVNTDNIIASHRKRDSLDPQVLRRYLFEDIAPAFAASIEPGDLIVAGKNFGCGSAMEVAVTALMGAGIRAVVAPSFARTYYRNAINNGLVAAVGDTADIAEGDQLVLEAGAVHNLTRGTTAPLEPLPPIMVSILEAGGLVAYLREHGDFQL